MMLIKYIFCFLSSVLLILPGVSQDAKTGFGMKAGYNSSNITGPWKEFFNSDTKVSPLRFEGAHFGAYFEIPMNKNLNFQPEFLITMKGAELDDVISGYIIVPPKSIGFTGLAAINFTLYYLQIPLVLKYNFNKNITLGGGVFYAELLDAIVKGAVSNNFSDPIYSSNGIPYNKSIILFNQSNTKGFKSKDFGLIACLEFNFTKAGLFIRYEKGLNSIFDDENITGKFKNTTLQLGINFRLKRHSLV